MPANVLSSPCVTPCYYGSTRNLRWFAWFLVVCVRLECRAWYEKGLRGVCFPLLLLVVLLLVLLLKMIMISM